MSPGDYENLIERLTRVETKLDIIHDEVRLHKERHFQFSKQGLLALLTSLVAIFLALFRR